MEKPPIGDICSYFTNLTDPRGSNVRHGLFDIIVMAICAVSGPVTCNVRDHRVATRDRRRA